MAVLPAPHLALLPPCSPSPRSRTRLQLARHHVVVRAGEDFVTKLVRQIFGEAAVNDPSPAGLTRMTREDWPDQWPPTTELADPLEGDEGEVVRLRPLLKQTCLEKQPLALVYDAQVDGWSAEAFHARLDGMGAAVLVCETAAGDWVGGYNPKGWLGYGDWRDAISAFLFTAAHKLPKVGGSGMAIIDEQGAGPQWGPDGLKVNIGQRSARSRLGSYYAKRPDGGRSLFGAGDDGFAELTSLRVYIGTSQTAKAAAYKPSILQWQPGELEALRARDSVDGSG